MLIGSWWTPDLAVASAWPEALFLLPPAIARYASSPTDVPDKYPLGETPPEVRGRRRSWVSIGPAIAAALG